MPLSRRLGIVLALAFLTLAAFSPPAQVPLIELTAEAGFDGRFRDGDWLPVNVRVSNQGDPVQGQLVVRPETSGAGITNTYSTPVDLPTGASQTVTLYVTARSFATQIRVEMMDEQGTVLAAAAAPLRAAQPLDRVYVVVSQSAAGVVDLTSATLGDHAAYQTNARIDALPALAAGLEPVDVLLFSDVDTSGLSADQRTAISRWVAAGGHLVVTGGSAWEGTAAGLVGLLPLVPEASTTVPDLADLAHWLRDDTPLEAETVIATGALMPDANVLVAAAETPLLARRAYGAGTVDYLAFDPNSAPLRGWRGLTRLWMALITTIDAQPGWNVGFSEWGLAAQAVEILPGYNLLPNVLPLCGFLGVYIALIGPINYFLLARLGRRELAWITIPLFIILFSVLSYVLGFNLRGTEATLSRLSLVRVWPDVEDAPVDALVGLLSPRRAQYDLALAGSGTVRPIPRDNTGGLLTGNVQSSVNVRQTDVFSAADFAVDASFIAGFNVAEAVTRPDLSGSASIARDPETGLLQVRGLVRNDSALTLNEPVILARGLAYRLDAPLAPGDTATFDVALPVDAPPSPLFFTPYGSGAGVTTSAFSMMGSPLNALTVNDLLGTQTLRPGARQTNESEEQRRRRLFLASIINDYPIASQITATGRGDHVYLAGWTSESPLELALAGANWTSSDTSLYLVDLEVEVVHPAGRVTITPDQFTWVGEGQTGLVERAPLNLSLQPGEQVSFRFTPLPSAVLQRVDRLTLRLERISMGGQMIPIELFNWETDAWEMVEVTQGDTSISQPARFLGPQNAVLVRVTSDLAGGFFRIEQLLVEQRGTF